MTEDKIKDLIMDELRQYIRFDMRAVEAGHEIRLRIRTAIPALPRELWDNYEQYVATVAIEPEVLKQPELIERLVQKMVREFMLGVMKKNKHE